MCTTSVAVIGSNLPSRCNGCTIAVTDRGGDLCNCCGDRLQQQSQCVVNMTDASVLSTVTAGGVFLTVS